MLGIDVALNYGLKRDAFNHNYVLTCNLFALVFIMHDSHAFKCKAFLAPARIGTMIAGQQGSRPVLKAICRGIHLVYDLFIQVIRQKRRLEEDLPKNYLS